MDNGKISTFAVTIAVILLGIVVANPDILRGLLGEATYAQYGALIMAIIIAIYNYAYPRLQKPTTESEGIVE